MLVRPVASIDELKRTEEVIAEQLRPRRSPPAQGLDALTARFMHDRTLMLVAEKDGEIVGGALALRLDDAVKIEALAIKPDARGRGIGRMLIETLEHQARRLGASAIYLGGANAENRGFYSHLGFAGRRSLMHKGLPVTHPSQDRRGRSPEI
jgi:predicted N-acetyltransferase YhbS